MQRQPCPVDDKSFSNPHPTNRGGVREIQAPIPVDTYLKIGPLLHSCAPRNPAVIHQKRHSMRTRRRCSELFHGCQSPTKLFFSYRSSRFSANGTHSDDSATKLRVDHRLVCPRDPPPIAPRAKPLSEASELAPEDTSCPRTKRIGLRLGRLHRSTEGESVSILL